MRDKPGAVELMTVNEFNEYVRECFSAAGDIVIKSMMGGYLVYLDGKLIGDIGGRELFLRERRHRTDFLPIQNCVILMKALRR